jgi:hypothetical protein
VNTRLFTILITIVSYCAVLLTATIVVVVDYLDYDDDDVIQEP